jgi:diguanylate cyclase (GGDEF)-like protein
MERVEETGTDPVKRAERLAVLHDLAILDTPAEPAYDDLATLAAAIAHSRIGAVNFVDSDRHWTKAVVGVQGGHGKSVPATLSLCAATIRSDEGTMTIPDTLDDDRWREHPFVDSEGGVRAYAGASIVVRGEPVGVVCVFGPEPRDFTPEQQAALRALARGASTHLELRERNFELRELASTDALTGLYNRTALFERLDAALTHGRRREHVGVLFCDVDDFKSVNDRFGHSVGDQLLCDIADRLRSAVRDHDTVARIAGDEFVVVAAGLKSGDELTSLVGRIEQSIGQLEPMPDGSPAPNLTVGAILAHAGEAATAVLARADHLMYSHKPSA